MTSANGKALVHNVHLVGRPLFYPKMLLLWRKIDFPNLLSSNSRNLPIKSLFKKIEIFLTWAANNTIGIWWNLVLDSGKKIRFDYSFFVPISITRIYTSCTSRLVSHQMSSSLPHDTELALLFSNSCTHYILQLKLHWGLSMLSES